MCYHRTILPVMLGMLIMILLCTGCLASEEVPEIAYSETASPELAWITTSMTDVATGERFTIKDLAEQGKPVILHSFAVWCPGCSMQLLESTKLQAAYPDKYVVVALDVDPNDNAAKVKRHQESNKFKGIFTTAPTDVTRSLINAYGLGFIQSIPQTIVICDKTATYLEDGVFKADTLKKALDSICS
ncbi:TlpA family protein disulfide reductase [Methanospirillum sp.]|uniref:TlpA family protein disulfide reductase n=1 Tax=Methanospirillum sp. TaxID=45200 RepID=UPI002987AFCE|nr:redoxin domain-containing protein [Methanospirillum sp.]